MWNLVIEIFTIKNAIIEIHYWISRSLLLISKYVTWSRSRKWKINRILVFTLSHFLVKLVQKVLLNWHFYASLFLLSGFRLPQPRLDSLRQFLGVNGLQIKTSRYRDLLLDRQLWSFCDFISAYWNVLEPYSIISSCLHVRFSKKN